MRRVRWARCFSPPSIPEINSKWLSFDKTCPMSCCINALHFYTDHSTRANTTSKTCTCSDRLKSISKTGSSMPIKINVSFENWFNRLLIHESTLIAKEWKLNQFQNVGAKVFDSVGSNPLKQAQINKNAEHPYQNNKERIVMQGDRMAARAYAQQAHPSGPSKENLHQNPAS